MTNNINLANEIITPGVAMALLPAFTSAYALAEEAAEAESHSTYDYKEEGQASTGLAALLKNIKL